MFNVPFGETLTKHREMRAYTKADLARRSGVQRRRLSTLEMGKRQPRKGELDLLCQALPEGAGELIRTARVERGESGGRSPGPANRQIHKLIRAPSLYLPRQRVATRKWWTGLLKEHFSLVDPLRRRILARSDAHAVLKHLERTACDSKLELVPYLQATAHGAGLCQVSVFRLGFTRHLPIDRQSRKLVGQRPVIAYLLARGERRVVIAPQVTLLTPDGAFTLDALALLIEGRRSLWAGYEVDGGGHDSTWDKVKRDALQLPELRFGELEVLSPDFLDCFWMQVGELLRR